MHSLGNGALFSMHVGGQGGYGLGLGGVVKSAGLQSATTRASETESVEVRVAAGCTAKSEKTATSAVHIHHMITMLLCS